MTKGLFDFGSNNKEEKLEDEIEKYLINEGWEVIRQPYLESDKNKPLKYRKKADLIIRHIELWEQGYFPYWIGLELKVEKENNSFSNIAKGIPQIVKKYQNQKFAGIEQPIGPWVLIANTSENMLFQGLNRVAIQFGIGTYSWNTLKNKNYTWRKNYNRFNFNPSNSKLAIPFDRDNLFDFDSNALIINLQKKGVKV